MIYLSVSPRSLSGHATATDTGVQNKHTLIGQLITGPRTGGRDLERAKGCDCTLFTGWIRAGCVCVCACSRVCVYTVYVHVHVCTGSCRCEKLFFLLDPLSVVEHGVIQVNTSTEHKVGLLQLARARPLHSHIHSPATVSRGQGSTTLQGPSNTPWPLRCQTSSWPPAGTLHPPCIMPLLYFPPLYRCPAGSRRR